MNTKRCPLCRQSVPTHSDERSTRPDAWLFDTHYRNIDYDWYQQRRECPGSNKNELTARIAN